MDVVREAFKLLLVIHAEAMLLVDNDEAELSPFEFIVEQRVCADDDGRSVSADARLQCVELRCLDESRGLKDIYPEGLETFAKPLGVLARQKRARYGDSNLEASGRADECSAHRNLGLPAPDVAAHDAIHRSALGQRLLDVRESLCLIRCGFVLEPVAEFAVRAALDFQ